MKPNLPRQRPKRRSAFQRDFLKVVAPDPLKDFGGAIPAEPVFKKLSCAWLQSKDKVSIKLLLRSHAAE
jgi:hypothetical protein